MRNRNRRAYRNKSDLNPDSGAKPKKMKKRELENKKEKFRKSREWKEFRSIDTIPLNNQLIHTIQIEYEKGYHTKHDT